ncbi:hypothetical protein ACIRPH_26585 [Nocardiopsis sp. NPDC101807]|uniref:hypothetical protein n=1 Tax=Nocardiopsis sp. NPDC101807 TaxID=3364339 RepID=UPI003809FBDA
MTHSPSPSPSPSFQPQPESRPGWDSSLPEDGSPFGGGSGRPSFAPPEPRRRGMSAADRAAAIVLGCVVVALVALVAIGVAVLLPV